MNKKQLLALLDHVGDDEEIVFLVPTGNYWHQKKAMPITDIRTGVVAFSKYLNCDQDLCPEDQEKAHWIDKDGNEIDINRTIYDPGNKGYYDGELMRPVRVLF